jgi:TctA family transporter
MEENLRRALLISRGDASVLVTRPISAGFLIATFLLFIVMIIPAIRGRRGQVTGVSASPAGPPRHSPFGDAPTKQPQADG